MICARHYRNCHYRVRSVLFVKFYKGYTKQAKEYDVAIIGTKWNLQVLLKLTIWPCFFLNQ